MKRNIIRNFFGVVLVLIIITSIFLVYKNIDEKEIKLDNVSLNKIDEYSGLAFLIEQSDGTYEKSENNDWPTEGYKLNQRLSGCVDNNGNTINKAVKYEYGTLKVKTRVNASCYLYFDRRKAATEELINAVSSEQLWDSTLEEDGYRYVGTNPDNYICFGTTDQEECINDTDKYMYRIIGIFEDEEGKQHLKLIKKEALNTEYAWHSDASTDTDWEDSDLYKGINGSYFATNSEYSYMQDSIWNGLIDTWNYIAINTLTYENSGINYHYSTVNQTYLHEMNRSTKTSSIGEWKKVNSKIGLMYVSDYQLSLGEKTLDYVNNVDYEYLKAGWMHISNNDVGANQDEWTISLYGKDNGNLGGWYVPSYGFVIGSGVHGELSVRPVFYLEADIELKEGLGTISEPYIINNDTAAEEIIGTAGSDLWDSTLEDDGYRYVGTNPDNYICFGTTSQEECMNDTDKYMYRIIGIFEDGEGKQHLKLIKKEALNTTYAWYNDNTVDVNWDESDLYKGINGSYFATNSEYSYMQDSMWTNKIAEWEYTATNTKAVENYTINGVYGPSYDYATPVSSIYLHEMNRTEKTNAICYFNVSTTADCSVGEWKTVSSKIGLMYTSDYNLSLGSTALGYTNNNSAHYALMKTGWMHLSNNDSGAPSSYEWTMSRYGGNRGYYGAWDVNNVGSIAARDFNNSQSVRPVFYLTSDTQLSKGTGTSSDPYTIKPAKVDSNTFTTEELIENAGDDLWDSTLEDDGYRYVGTNPDNYVCFGYSNATTDCDFTNTTNTDLYAYRIIGIFEDSEGTPHIKLIKKEALNTTYMWESDYESDIDWEESDLYKGLNGISGGDYSNIFVGSTEYKYMSTSSSWYNKIAEWEYTSTNTQTYYIGSSTSNVGAHYYYSWPIGIYNSEHEINTTTGCYPATSGSTINCKTTASYTYPESKISLMYASDYALSLGATASTMTGSTYTNRATLKTGWMHISNNDSGALSAYEWTSSRFGANSNGWYDAWRLDSDGHVNSPGVNNTISVRPVFYLTSEVELSGEGTSTSPYIIK